MPCQLLIPILEPWDRLFGTWWVVPVLMPAQALGLGSIPDGPRCGSPSSNTALPWFCSRARLAGLLWAAGGCVVHGRKCWLTGVNSDCSPGGIPHI